MPPKKSKKKDNSAEEDVDKVQLLNNKVQTLQKQYVDEQEIADYNRATQN